MTLCVYAVTTVAPMDRGGRGIGGEPLRLVRAGTVGAIVGTLSGPRRPTIANLRRYDAVIRRLAESRRAILPARFGECFADADELLLVLRSRQGAIRRALARVAGRVQMTIRILPSTSPLVGGAGSAQRTRDDASDDARRAGPARRLRHSRERPGSAYLKAAAARAAAARSIPHFDDVRSAVTRWVRAEHVDKHADIVSVYHLVPRTAPEAYRHAVTQAAARAGLRVVVSGPSPVYAFARDQQLPW